MFSGGVANFKKSPIFTLKLHDFVISEKKIWPAGADEIFFGRSNFQKKNSKKTVKNPKFSEGVKKPFSKGWGHKKSK